MGNWARVEKASLYDVYATRRVSPLPSPGSTLTIKSLVVTCCVSTLADRNWLAQFSHGCRPQPSLVQDVTLTITREFHPLIKSMIEIGTDWIASIPTLHHFTPDLVHSTPG
jgi:hypothetical protein